MNHERNEREGSLGEGAKLRKEDEVAESVEEPGRLSRDEGRR